MNEILSIGITTFKNRFDFLETQINKIRSFNTDINILITVNGNYQEEFDENYRKKILELSLKYNNVFPLFFPKFTGLAKMWNNLIVHSPTPFIYIISDDVLISNSNVFTIILDHIKTINHISEEMFEAPSEYAHFVISKKLAIEINFFDERLIGFGEEDGDFVWQYISKYIKHPLKLNVPGIRNIRMAVDPGLFDFSHATTDPLYEFQPKIKRTPRFNTEFRMAKYKPNKNGIQGMYQYKMGQHLLNKIQYPYEKFILDNYNNLGNFKKINL